MKIRLLKKINPPKQRQFCMEEFTIVELLIVISVICILIMLMLPALKSARDTSRRIKCISNLRQLGITQMSYADTYDSYLWCGNGWGPGLHPFSGLTSNVRNMPFGTFYTCPSDTDPRILWTTHYSSYGQNSWGYMSTGLDYYPKLSQFVRPAELIFMGDSNKNWCLGVVSAGVTKLKYRHNNGLNVLYLDGHARGLKTSEVPPRSAGNSYPWAPSGIGAWTYY